MGVPLAFGVPRPAPSFTPAFVAVDRGFLSAEGLEARIIYQRREQDLLTGEVDFIVGRLGHVEFLKGADIRLICGLAREGGSHVLIARPEIASVAQLREVTVAAEENVLELRSILAHYGVDLDRSGIKTPIIEGSHPKQYEALKRGVGDGAMLGAPWWIYAIRDGYKNMGSGSEYGEDLPHLVIYAAAEKIVRQPDQTRGFVTAMVKSMEYCRKNVPATLETVMRYSGQWGVDNVEIARMVYDVFVPNWSAEIDIAAAARLLEHASHKLGKPTPPLESFVDLSFLREAQREVG